MNIAFYIDEMNLRGVANSTYKYAHYNEKILKNKSLIFYNKKNHRNIKTIIRKYSKRFKVIGVENFKKIDKHKEKLKLDFVYAQKGGERDAWSLKKIKTLVHCIYPQLLKEVHGDRYAYASEWLGKEFSNNKLKFVPYIVELSKTKKNLKKKLKIKNKQIVFGCHGGASSFDINFVKDVIGEIVQKKKKITFLFLNINKFINHPRIIFLKGTHNELYKKQFLNTCDAMIYGRSLGESFGLACGEFAVLGKPILSYKYNRHRSHIFDSPKELIMEYHSKKNLLDKLSNFNKKNFKIKSVNKYLNYTPEKVMKIFKSVFLGKKIKKITIQDKLFNFLSFIRLNSYYLKHKIYTHYYKFFIKFINF